MAYDKAEILKQALTAITENELTTIPEVESYLPCDESTLYSNDEWKVEVLDPLKKALEVQKTNLKAKLKATWRKAESAPALQIAAFKLMATDDELNVLNTSKVQAEHSGKNGDPIKYVVEILDGQNTEQ